MPWLQTEENLRLLGIYAHPHDCTHALGTMGNHVNGHMVAFAHCKYLLARIGSVKRQWMRGACVIRL